MTRQDELIEAWCKYRGKCSTEDMQAIDFALRWCDEHPHWISVEDELPKDGEYIIITDGGDLTTTALYGGYDGLTKDTFIKNITHWMPLPSTDHLADASKKADHSIDTNKKVEHLIDTNKMMEGE